MTIFNPAGTQRSKAGDPGFTLTLCGSLILNGATASFGTTDRGRHPRRCRLPRRPRTSNGQQVTVQVPASLLTAVAEFPVTIKNPQSRASNAIPYYVGMNIYFDQSSDVVWDSRNNLLYVSKPSTAQQSQGRHRCFSTRTGLNDTAAAWIYQLPAGSNPDRMALSGDGKYLYVGLDGAGDVQQLTITRATDPADCRHHDFAGIGVRLRRISRARLGGFAHEQHDHRCGARSDAFKGQRRWRKAESPFTTAPLSGPTPSAPLRWRVASALLDTLQWSADGNTIYAANNENATGDLYVLNVSPSRRGAGQPEETIEASSPFRTCLFTSIRRPACSMEMTACKWTRPCPRSTRTRSRMGS